jgi:hypothetical protein
MYRKNFKVLPQWPWKVGQIKNPGNMWCILIRCIHEKNWVKICQIVRCWSWLERNISMRILNWFWRGIFAQISQIRRIKEDALMFCRVRVRLIDQENPRFLLWPWLDLPLYFEFLYVVRKWVIHQQSHREKTDFYIFLKFELRNYIGILLI